MLVGTSTQLLEKYQNNILAQVHFISETDVLNVVKKSNASGCENITPKMLQYTLPVILPIITHIINIYWYESFEDVFGESSTQNC